MEIAVLSESTGLDVEVHKTLVAKSLDKRCRITFRFQEKVHFQGKHDLLGSLHIAIDLLVSQFPHLGLIVVVVDSDRLSRNEQKKEVENIIKKKVGSFPSERIVIGVAVRNLEAWLLTDEKAIAKVAGFPIKEPFGKAENIKHPKNNMKQIYGTYCKEAIRKSRTVEKYPDFVKNIASNLSLQLLSKKSRSFRAFRDDLRGAHKRFRS